MSNEYSPACNDRFLNLYRQLEQLLGYDRDTARYLKARYYDEIETYRKLRNYLSHEQYEGGYPFCVSSSLCDDLERLLESTNKRVIDICTREVRHVTVGMKLTLVKAMFLENGYTYLPIFDDRRRVIGVISSLVLLAIDEKVKPAEDARIIDLLPYFALENQNRDFLFLPRNEAAHKEVSRFSTLSNGRRVGMAFVTENGKQEEAVLGVITVMDALRYYREAR